MPITINGSGTVSGISAGGLPDDSIVTADIANGAVTQAKRSEQLTLGTAQNSTSDTAIDFTGIPSWVKRITVMFNGVSTNGTSPVLIQLGTSGGITTSGYATTGVVTDTTALNTITSTAGVYFHTYTATEAKHGNTQIAFMGSNTWTYNGLMRLTATQSCSSAGSVTLSGTLDRVRITTVNGIATFDAGSINILYE